MSACTNAIPSTATRAKGVGRFSVVLSPAVRTTAWRGEARTDAGRSSKGRKGAFLPAGCHQQGKAHAPLAQSKRTVEKPQKRTGPAPGS